MFSCSSRKKLLLVFLAFPVFSNSKSHGKVATTAEHVMSKSCFKSCSMASNIGVLFLSYFFSAKGVNKTPLFSLAGTPS